MIEKIFFYIIVLAAIININVLYIDYPFYILLLVAIIIPFLGFLLLIFYDRQSRRSFSVTKHTISYGDSLSLMIEENNKLPFLAFFSGRKYLTLHIEYSNPDDKCNRTYKNIPVDPDNPTITDICPIHEGIVTITLKRLIVQDVMGLTFFRKKLNKKFIITVMPKLVDTSIATSFSSTEEEESFGVKGHMESDFSDVKKYQPGDKINRIHWNLSLKMDDLYVRHYNSENVAKKVVLVDLSKNDDKGYRDNLDIIYKATYSVIYLILNMGYDCILEAYDGISHTVIQQVIHRENETYDNSDYVSPEEALKVLMSIRCSDHAGGLLVDNYLSSLSYDKKGAIYITQDTSNIDNHKGEKTEFYDQLTFIHTNEFYSSENLDIMERILKELF